MSEDIIIRHCSPTLAGMKTGNLFSCPFVDEDEMRCKLVGYWKVYGNEEKARTTFAKYKKCTDVYVA